VSRIERNKKRKSEYEHDVINDDEHQSEVDEAAKLKASENDSETAMQIDLCDDCDSKEMEE
jgi:hypothetical protein